MNELIKIADFYEWTLSSIQSGDLTKKEEQLTIDNLKSLEWIAQRIKNYSLNEAKYFCNILTQEIKRGVFPPEPMSVSCFYYNFKKKGVDTSQMYEAINTSPHLIDSCNLLLGINN